jgi:hypothetical protein
VEYPLRVYVNWPRKLLDYSLEDTDQYPVEVATTIDSWMPSSLDLSAQVINALDEGEGDDKEVWWFMPVSQDLQAVEAHDPTVEHYFVLVPTNPNCGHHDHVGQYLLSNHDGEAHVTRRVKVPAFFINEGMSAPAFLTSHFRDILSCLVEDRRIVSKRSGPPEDRREETIPLCIAGPSPTGTTTAPVTIRHGDLISTRFWFFEHRHTIGYLSPGVDVSSHFMDTINRFTSVLLGKRLSVGLTSGFQPLLRCYPEYHTLLVAIHTLELEDRRYNYLDMVGDEVPSQYQSAIAKRSTGNYLGQRWGSVNYPHSTSVPWNFWDVFTPLSKTGARYGLYGGCAYGAASLLFRSKALPPPPPLALPLPPLEEVREPVTLPPEVPSIFEQAVDTWGPSLGAPFRSDPSESPWKRALFIYPCRIMQHVLDSLGPPRIPVSRPAFRAHTTGHSFEIDKLTTRSLFSAPVESLPIIPSSALESWHFYAPVLFLAVTRAMTASGLATPDMHRMTLSALNVVAAHAFYHGDYGTALFAVSLNVVQITSDWARSRYVAPRTRETMSTFNRWSGLIARSIAFSRLHSTVASHTPSLAPVVTMLS